jgi:4-hydroxythreonine-4-phosphate dehydrogenase
MSKPIIGITLGDAAGIGPEIIVKALADTVLYQQCRPLVIGDAAILNRAIRVTSSPISIQSIAHVEEARFQPGIIDCLDMPLLPTDLQFGQLSAVAGDAAYLFLEKAVHLAVSGDIDAICTAPLNKEAMNLGGHAYPGHTEILAELTGTRDYAMMFVSPRLNVSLVTIHIGLVEAIRRITPESIYRTIVLTASALQRMGYADPHLAVCALNPHAGEQGMFGEGEEEEKIKPGIQRAQENGLRVSGPYPADTIFYRAVRGDFNAVVALYHDQGLIAIKTLGIQDAVNITIGLPIIRTSVDHGTAFDIAGTGKADESNLTAAILQAVELAERSS